MSLSKHRKAIDGIDSRIIKLLNERTSHVLEIGAIKMRQKSEIYAPHRELAVLEQICRQNQGPIQDDSLRAIYREIMSSALSLEKTMVIAYLGPEATFTHQAAIQRFGSSLTYASQNTIADVFTEVSKSRADYGVVPVENSTEGVVTHTLDMFVDSDLKIVSQVVLPIRHCLLSRGAREQIRKFYVHPQTLAQCRGWLHRHYPHAEIIESSSNARSAELASRSKRAAAIAGTLAAETYKMPILEYDIQDHSTNATRFLVLGRTCSPPTGRDRTSILFSITDKSGSLYSALSPFHRCRLNMTRIESRPSKRKAWEYFFFVDVDGHEADTGVANAIGDLKKTCLFVKVLGSYPNGKT